MKNCTKNDMSDKLAMALSADEFPENIVQIEEHLKNCRPCQEELHALKLMDSYLREHKDSLAGAVCGCPSAEELVDFAEGATADPQMARHLEDCPDCPGFVQLARDLRIEEPKQSVRGLTQAQKRFIRETVSAKYGVADESIGSRIAAFMENLRTALSFPSLAVGAVAAALLIVCLMPRGPKQEGLVPLLSDVTWDSSASTSTKAPIPSGQPTVLRKKVAVIMLASGTDTLSAKEVNEVYGRFDIAKKLGSSYEFLSPRDLRAALADQRETHDLKILAGRVFGSVKPDYIVFFQVSKLGSSYSLKGILFQGDRADEKAHIFHSGLSLDRLPSLMTVIGSELLMDAEYSFLLVPERYALDASSPETGTARTSRQDPRGH